MIIKNKLDIGFADKAGEYNRTIIRVRDLFIIGCFEGSYNEAFKAISKKYQGAELKKYLDKLDESKLDRDDELLINHDYWRIREYIAKESLIYHNILKDDIDADVRLAIVKTSNYYHDQFKDDKNEYVREAVAKASDRYHNQFKYDRCWQIRLIVAEYSDLYHKHLKDDPHKLVRSAVADYKKET